MLCICTEYEHLLPVKDLDGVRPTPEAELLKSLLVPKNMIMKSDVYHMGDYSSVDPKCTKSVKFLKMYSRRDSSWFW